jgi:lipopolysaccharide transport system ATP-binding protein
MKPIIEVQNLYKKYQINAQQSRYLSIRDSLSNVFSFNKKSKKEDFWALQDINFTVEAGESVGIIGKNGAGKSTLLKILSRITPPTKGQVILRGRIASLLEVGTGFHPELSGRENVYFNGSILGLKKAEIDRKFDEIVDFSGVEQFIDTPLKQYSSGMKLRLAFSVAAHLEPEILVIDEVLAVGDAEFQKKCLGKMDDVTKSGRTVLFVSHNMGAITQLCTSAILMDNGIINEIGTSAEIVKYYYSLHKDLNKICRIDVGSYKFASHPLKKDKNTGILTALLLVDGQPSDIVFTGQKVEILIEFLSNREMIVPEIGIVIKDSSEKSYLGLNNQHLGKNIEVQANKILKARICIPNFPIYGNDTFTIDLFFGDTDPDYECLIDAMFFELKPNDVYKSGRMLDLKFNAIYHNKISISND